jgi:hypothetical protein
MQRFKTHMPIYSKDKKKRFRAQIINSDGFRGFTDSIQAHLEK